MVQVNPNDWQTPSQITRLVEEDKIKIIRDNVKGRYGWEIKISSMDLLVPESQENVLEQIRKIDHDLRIMFGTEDSPVQHSGAGEMVPDVISEGDRIIAKDQETLQKIYDTVSGKETKKKVKKEPKDGEV